MKDDNDADQGNSRIDEILNIFRWHSKQKICGWIGER